MKTVPYLTSHFRPHRQLVPFLAPLTERKQDQSSLEICNRPQMKIGDRRSLQFRTHQNMAVQDALLDV